MPPAHAQSRGGGAPPRAPSRYDADVIRLPPEGLVAFAAVIDEGGVSQAARALNLTQPAVSNRMRALQTIAGGPLYERKGGQTVPTEIGARLLPHARAVAHALDRASTELADAQAPVRVAVSEAAEPLVVPRLTRLTLAQPDLDIEISTGPGMVIVEDVLSGRIDIGVTAAAPYGGGEHLDRATIAEDEVLLLRAADGSAAAPSAPLMFGDVTILWQAPSSGVRRTVERALEAAGIAPSRRLELGSTHAAIAAAAAGLGCCFVNRAAARTAIDAGKVVAIAHGLGALYAHIELVAQPADFLPAHHRRVREALTLRNYHESEYKSL